MFAEIESPFGNFCRTCMTQDNEADTEFQSIFDAILNTEKPISDLLKIIMGCNLIGKPLPNRMCGKCVQRIGDVHEFQQMCLRTQSKFLQMTEEKEYSGEIVVPSESLLDAAVEQSDPLKEDKNMEVDVREEATQDLSPENALSSDDDFNWPSEEETCETESKEVTIQTNNRPFKCDVCCQTFRNAKNLSDHKRVLHPPSVFVCSICGKGYKVHRYFVKHMLEHKSERMGIRKPPEPVTCEICNKVFSKIRYLKAHKRIHTKEKNFLCKKSEENMQADGREEATQDQRPESSLSSDDDVHWPNEDGKFGSESEEVTSDIQTQSDFVCLTCGQVFTKQCSFNRHMLKHKYEDKDKIEKEKDENGASLMKIEEGTSASQSKNPQKTKTCEICHKVLSSSRSLSSHKRTHTDEKNFLCKECGKAFKNQTELAAHEKRHAGVKQYECPLCPKKFVDRGNLSAHKRTHSDSKPHVCDVCGAAFKFTYILKKHKVFHGEKTVKCEQCDMRFYTVDLLRRHRLTHTGEKPYSCKYCERAFAQPNDLISHLRTHVGRNVYRCELCPMGFPMLREKRKHFASHKNEDEATRKKNLEALAESNRSLNHLIKSVKEIHD